MNMSADSTGKQPQVSHVDEEAIGPDGPSSSYDLSEEQIQDQIAAHIRISKLSFTSWSSIQLYIFFFIAYCSKLLPSISSFGMKVTNLIKILGVLGSIAH